MTRKKNTKKHKKNTHTHQYYDLYSSARLRCRILESETSKGSPFLIYRVHFHSCVCVCVCVYLKKKRNAKRKPANPAQPDDDDDDDAASSPTKKKNQQNKRKATLPLRSAMESPHANLYHIEIHQSINKKSLPPPPTSLFISSPSLHAAPSQKNDSTSATGGGNKKKLGKQNKSKTQYCRANPTGPTKKNKKEKVTRPPPQTLTAINFARRKSLSLSLSLSGLFFRSFHNILY